MDILGAYKVSLTSIRAMAIQYHALDLSAYNLFLDGTHVGSSIKTKTIYEELVTRQLLALAIAIRTKFYQGCLNNGTEKYVVHCGFLYNEENGKEVALTFTIKDVCDKIIHADSLHRELENGVKIPLTILKGRGRGGVYWELSLSGSLFAEAILNWVEDLEKGVNE